MNELWHAHAGSAVVLCLYQNESTKRQAVSKRHPEYHNPTHECPCEAQGLDRIPAKSDSTRRAGLNPAMLPRSNHRPSRCVLQHSLQMWAALPVPQHQSLAKQQRQKCLQRKLLLRRSRRCRIVAELPHQQDIVSRPLEPTDAPNQKTELSQSFKCRYVRLKSRR